MSILDPDRRVNQRELSRFVWNRGRHAHALGGPRWRGRREVQKNGHGRMPEIHIIFRVCAKHARHSQI
jgi:hypothetical protein